MMGRILRTFIQAYVKVVLEDGERDVFFDHQM